jgi:hypothetical protein
MEESPAISPDGKTVAFVARAGNRWQIWIRLLAGGVPLQITTGDADRMQPRWTPDSAALIYYTPSAALGEQGAVWEIPALGAGAPGGSHPRSGAATSALTDDMSPCSRLKEGGFGWRL